MFDRRLDGRPGRAGVWMYAPLGVQGREIAHYVGARGGWLHAACQSEEVVATDLSWWSRREPLDGHANCPACVLALQLDRDKDTPAELATMVGGARALTSPTFPRKKKKRRAR